jgi:hypothetical protein
VSELKLYVIGEHERDEGSYEEVVISSSRDFVLNKCSDVKARLGCQIIIRKEIPISDLKDGMLILE